MHFAFTQVSSYQFTQFLTLLIKELNLLISKVMPVSPRCLHQRNQQYFFRYISQAQHHISIIKVRCNVIGVECQTLQLLHSLIEFA